MEDYKEKYENALPYIKDLIEHNVISKENASKYFPEVCESEDEKTRKEIIDYLNERQILETCTETKVNERWISWLEKQGEKKEIDYDEELKKCKDNPLYFYDKYVKIKLKEQKPAEIKLHGGSVDNPYDMSFEEAQEYAYHRGFDIPMSDGDVFVDERYIIQTIGNILRWADDNPKQKPMEWSEGDDIRLNHLIDFIQKYGLQYYASTDKVIDWLKSIKPQPKQEWSKKDEDVWRTLLFNFEDMNQKCLWGCEENCYVIDIVNFLKSLKPQSHWKPSEEQMEALKDAVKLYKSTHFDNHHYKIESLYNDLQKL